MRGHSVARPGRRHHVREYACARRAMSNSSGAMAQRERRVGAPRRLARKHRGFAGDRTHLVELAVAMKRPHRSRPRARHGVRSASVPDNAPIEISSLISRPWNPMKPRITCRSLLCRSRGRRDGVDGAEHNMRRHARAASPPEAGTPRNRSPRVWRGRHRPPAAVMAVGSGAAMPGHVLEHRQHAARRKPSAIGPAQ